MSAIIIPLLNDASFDPAVTQAMGEAYDKARQMLHDRGQPDVVQEVIERSIIEVAKTGERDPVRLAERALNALGIEGSL